MILCLASSWPLNESEAGGDLVLIETSLVFLHKLLKNSIINIKTRSPAASLSFKGQAAKHATVK